MLDRSRNFGLWPYLAECLALTNIRLRPKAKIAATVQHWILLLHLFKNYLKWLQTLESTVRFHRFSIHFFVSVLECGRQSFTASYWVCLRSQEAIFLRHNKADQLEGLCYFRSRPSPYFRAPEKSLRARFELSIEINLLYPPRSF